jgi:hypothetical protein
MLERVKKPPSTSLQLLRTGDSIGAEFFSNNDQFLAILGSIVSAVIFGYWTLRLFQDNPIGPILIVLYSFTVLLSVPFWNSLTVSKSNSGMVAEYRRPGVSWLNLVEAQAGGFLIFVVMYWLISNSMVDNQGLLFLINSGALVFATYIIPFLPLIGKLPMTNVLKTRLVYLENDGLDLHIHPLDFSWSRYDEEELKESLESQLQALIDSLQKKT